jgi:hypothetical protein
MPTAKKSEPNRWSNELTSLIAALEAAQKQMRTLSPDPFTALRQLDGVRDRLMGVGLRPLDAIERVRKEIETECLRLEVEFWGMLSDACRKAGWDLFGNTNRRLVHRAIFIALDGQSVRIEGALAGCAPFVPAVMTVLSEHLQGLGGSESELKSFLATLVKVYDNTPRPAQECSLEALFRQCVLEAQKPTFWRNPTSKSFTALTRPIFRYRISELLRLGLSTTDGRTISLGTTTMSKDVWELYSPGEQRVVQAGRLSLIPGNADHEN